jgi:predicted dehydrogenase
MKFLIIGLGSMGKRRIRNLHALGMKDVFGFDFREDRRKEAQSKYGTTTYATFTEALAANNYDAFVISVPPDKHHIYMNEALRLKKPFFVEASVVDDDMESIKKKIGETKVVAAPSSTMYFHPAIAQVRKLIETKAIGDVTNINYHSGQYLPDWHTYETVKDFYVSKKETGGAREIVPFELTWLVAVFGFPKYVCGMYRKTIFIEGGESIDDTYIGLFDYGKFILNLTVDVVSRSATRKLLINASEGQLQWDWNDSFISVYTPAKGWVKNEFEMIGAEQGYNKNITEQMYIDELSNFIAAVKGEKAFVNDMATDHKVLRLLYALEKSQDTGKTIAFQ